MIIDKIVIDNFFSEEELSIILNDAQTVEYYGPTTHPDAKQTLLWQGVRSGNLLRIHHERYNSVVNKIFEKSIAQSFGDSPFKFQYRWHTYIYFHILPDLFNESWVHRDNDTLYAGVIYLNKTPTKNSGTVIVDVDGTHVVENVFNRLVMYNGNNLHSAENGFEDRLTLTFFVSAFMIDCQHNRYEKNPIAW